MHEFPPHGEDRDDDELDHERIDNGSRPQVGLVVGGVAGHAGPEETPQDVRGKRHTRVQSDRPTVLARRNPEEDHVSGHDAGEHTSESQESDSVDRACDEGERDDEGVTFLFERPGSRAGSRRQIVNHGLLTPGRAAAEERLDEDGIVLKITWRPREHDTATAEHARPVRDAQCRLGALFDEQDRRPVVGEAPDVLLEQLGRDEGRQVRRWLVKHEH